MDWAFSGPDTPDLTRRLRECGSKCGPDVSVKKPRNSLAHPTSKKLRGKQRARARRARHSALQFRVTRLATPVHASRRASVSQRIEARTTAAPAAALPNARAAAGLGHESAPIRWSLPIAAMIVLPILVLVAWNSERERLRGAPPSAPAVAQAPVVTDTEIAARIAGLQPGLVRAHPLPDELRPVPPQAVERHADAAAVPETEVAARIAAATIPFVPLALPRELTTPAGEIHWAALAMPSAPPSIPASRDAKIELTALRLPDTAPDVPPPGGAIEFARLVLRGEPPRIPAEPGIAAAAPGIAAPPADGQLCRRPAAELPVHAALVPGGTIPAHEFGAELAKAAAAQLKSFVIYSARYTAIAYPMGDVAPLFGSCTDVVIRAYRALGIDLQELVQKSRSGVGDRSIDHRRTETLRRFLAAYGTSLPITDFHENYQPGDIVTYYRPHSRVSSAHIAIVSHETAPSGRPMIIHNRGWGPQIEDALFVDRITGHYRFSGLQAPTMIARAKPAPQLPQPAVVRPAPAAYAAMGMGALAPVPPRSRACAPEYSGLLKARAALCQPAATPAAPQDQTPKQASVPRAVLAK
jgi:uncharacterized protein YijF (DUF1287 family)